jgi:hypothetical protein
MMADQAPVMVALVGAAAGYSDYLLTVTWCLMVS